MIECSRPIAATCVFDVEFHQPAGERPVPLCLAWQDVATGEAQARWVYGEGPRAPPFLLRDDTLVATFAGSGDLACLTQLGWPQPAYHLDLHAEFRCLTNGLLTAKNSGLVHALRHFGLDAPDPVQKQRLQQLAVRGGPYSAAERDALVEYCRADVAFETALFRAMLPLIDGPRALFRGRYVKAVSGIELAGIPVDSRAAELLFRHWEAMRLRLAEQAGGGSGVFEGRSFRMHRFEALLVRLGVQWPRTATGKPKTDRETFEEMADLHPELREVCELRRVLGQVKVPALGIGRDGRHRFQVKPFLTTTSRNAPSATGFIFGLPRWVRALIRPHKGRALALIDWSRQEFGTAAALSRDPAMWQAYLAPDIYLEFGKLAGAIPQWATVDSHPEERAQFKQCVLAAQFGGGSELVARRLQVPLGTARQLLATHHRVFARYWAWVEEVTNAALLRGELRTIFGWKLQVAAGRRTNSIANFPVQAAGAEMLRVAVCLLAERGIQVDALVHDAVLVEADVGDIEETVAAAQGAMAEASELVLRGYRLRTDVKITRHPDVFAGASHPMWPRVWKIVNELSGEPTAGPKTTEEER
ncbi:MAG: DNA polymerase [Deferrisomatales bacterium]|nr:DNA polymerase [Deferrisomatales bacterium]